MRKNQDPHQLFEIACSLGKQIEEVTGSVWLKVQSQEVSGQFPAQVITNVKNQQLQLEVTNLTGATEALVEIQKEDYTIHIPGKKVQKFKDTASWGGIPLVWAIDLFGGRIPCPRTTAPQKLALSISHEGDLVVETHHETPQGIPQGMGMSERFVYHFRSWAGSQWPESMYWTAAGNSIKLFFNDPEDRTLSPRRWEAQSQHGSVILRWRERKVTYSASR